jgi:hypothetical protein
MAAYSSENAVKPLSEQSRRWVHLHPHHTVQNVKIAYLGSVGIFLTIDGHAHTFCTSEPRLLKFVTDFCLLTSHVNTTSLNTGSWRIP